MSDDIQKQGDHQVPQKAAPAIAGGMTAAEVLLADDQRDRNPIVWGSIALAALIFHAIILFMAIPDIKTSIAAPSKQRKVMTVRKYVPPPPKKKQPKKIEKKITKKVPIPDPTPDEPEPIIEPDPLPDPEPLPDDIDIVIGTPEPPPVTGPLIPGVGGVTEPVLVQRVEPTYPELARRARIQGKVILRAVIKKDGSVGDIELLKEPQANLGFSDSAIDAVRQWRYQPGRQNGKPVDVYFTVIVTFSLD